MVVDPAATRSGWDRRHRVGAVHVVVVVPTYNEVDNIEPLCRRIRAALPDARIEALFDLGYHTKHVDTIFARVFG